MKKFLLIISATIVGLFALFIILGLNGGVLPNICKFIELFGMSCF